MYDWRRMDADQRRATLEHRRNAGQPAHDLPHFDCVVTEFYSITGTNYEHKVIVGVTDRRMDGFAKLLRQAVAEAGFQIEAWCLMPNHYHLLVKGADCPLLRSSLGGLHGRSSHNWNKEEGIPGRKVWYRVFDRPILSQRQYYSTLNYIHFNPVADGLCNRMTDWKWSSISDYLKRVGMTTAREIWKTYPPAESAAGRNDCHESGLQARFT